MSNETISPRNEQKRILLIDDESSIRRSLSLSLNQLGYDVEPCDSGLTALNKLELYKRNSVNLDSVVVDVNLPDINGLKLGRIIKSKYPDAAMMYITGYADKLEVTEIEELKEDGLLEKPFTADDLIIEINKILNKHPRQTKEVIKEEAKTTSAYALIKVKEDVNYFTLYQKIYFMQNVLYCDATRGDIDIFVLLQSDSMEKCKEIYEKEILTLEGISESILLPVSIPLLNDNIKEIVQSAGISLFEDNPAMSKIRDSKKAVYSYVLLDIDREKLERVYPVLRLTENILYCDYTSGKYNIIMMIFGSQFSEIDKIIENKIISLDGVLKVKEYPVINIFEM
ncbi:MAG: response regulator [Ignavibacteriales bacterium]|nr:MAG: response regulator [Ignavibacteriales bacterium]